MKKLCFIISALLLFAAGCADKYDAELGQRLNNEKIEHTPREDTVQALIDNMSIDDKLWQLFFVTPEAVADETRLTEVTASFTENAKIKKVGGIILFAENLKNADQVYDFNAQIAAAFDIPVFIGVDEEGGSVARLGKKGIITDNGDMRAIGDSGDIGRAAQVGERLAAELSALGFNMDFAPVADVIIDRRNTEIGRRSFGTDPDLVSGMVAAQVSAMENGGISAAIKHFPGHGSTTANSHNSISISERTLDQLRSEELLPFKAGIEAGADFVMVSHMSLPHVTGDETPCSLSPAMINELLKTELGFDGIAITDALNMGAVTKRYGAGNAAVMAVEAGADMLLMPGDLNEAHAALVSAVMEGRISEARIDDSVRRILKVKKAIGLIM